MEMINGTYNQKQTSNNLKKKYKLTKLIVFMHFLMTFRGTLTASAMSAHTAEDVLQAGPWSYNGGGSWIDAGQEVQLRCPGVASACDWSDWSSCSKTCGSGIRTRSRHERCEGTSIEYEDCIERACKP